VQLHPVINGASQIRASALINVHRHEQIDLTSPKPCLPFS